MKNKTVVITGATSGIGEAAALALARQGARVVFTARDRAKADATLVKLQRENSDAAHGFHIADLASGTRRKSVSFGERAGISLALSLVSRSGSNNLPLRGHRSGLGCGYN
jgi:NAD(P)-dependent dehydrogenase (short-subunit alcohol dehydrogenase family)